MGALTTRCRSITGNSSSFPSSIFSMQIEYVFGLSLERKSRVRAGNVGVINLHFANRNAYFRDMEVRNACSTRKM